MFVLHGVTIVDLSMHFGTFLSTSSFLSKEHEDGLEDIALLTALSITAIKFQSKLYMHFNQLNKTTIFKICKVAFTRTSQ